jgi:peroxiredoxin
VQILGVSVNSTFSQQAFAESLKLPYPLLSDYAERKVTAAYGVMKENATISARRAFFLIDPQGVIRKKWIVENGSTTTVYSDTVLKGIREVMGKP